MVSKLSKIKVSVIEYGMLQDTLALLKESARMIDFNTKEGAAFHVRLTEFVRKYDDNSEADNE